MSDAPSRYIIVDVVLWKCEKIEKLPLVMGIASTYSQTCVTEFHLKILSENMTKIKMGMAGLERCYTNGRTWEEIKEEELWEDMDGEAWLEVDQHKVAMGKERENKFGVFTVEFAQGSWTLYLIYFFNNYIASSCD